MHLIIKFYRTEFNLYLMIQQAYQNHEVLREIAIIINYGYSEKGRNVN